jgi:hypothetical protein
MVVLKLNYLLVVSSIQLTDSLQKTTVVDNKIILIVESPQNY